MAPASLTVFGTDPEVIVAIEQSCADAGDDDIVRVEDVYEREAQPSPEKMSPSTLIPQVRRK